MELRSDARWSLVVPTSMGIRITPDNGQPVHTSDRFTMQVTSAETNVASVPSSPPVVPGSQSGQTSAAASTTRTSRRVRE